MRRAGIATCIAGALLFGAVAAQAESRKTNERSVVGLTVTHQQWDEDRPWARRDPDTRRVSGVVIEGPYILTTAQMVADATLIQLEKFGRSSPYAPRAVLIDPEVDLALFAVDDPAFYQDLVPVKLARQTPVDGALRTVRWNGQQLESLVSRVKRFEVQESFFGELEHPFLQVQTDLSGGGWAEPVFDDDRLVGMTVSQTEQRARVIPAEVIATFLERALAPDPYTGFPVLGVKWQVNRDPALAAFLGQTEGPSGVVIRQVPWGTSGCGVLEPQDILLSIDGQAINDEGFYTHPRLGQLRFTNIITEKHRVGDEIPVRVLRDGEPIDLRMTLRAYPNSMQLIPPRRGSEPPPFVIAGGLLFRELDGDYLRSWGNEWSSNAPLQLVTRYYLDRESQRPERRRIVLLAGIFPSSYTVGYLDVRDQSVASINGRVVSSINDVADAFASPIDGRHVVVLEANALRREIVLDAAELDAATGSILEEYRIPLARRLPDRPLPEGGPACSAGF